MTEVAILGAGAAGLLCAIRAAERGRRVLLLEKNRKPGVKVLMSGGTRCNITHEGSADEMLRAFPRKAARFLRPSFLAFTPARAIDFFTEHGVPVKVEPPHGKVFPRSDRATDVLRALLDAAREKKVELRCESPVARVERAANGFSVALESGEALAAGRVVVATGGASYPKVGTTGDGYAIARSFGHTVSVPRPALVPLVLREPLEECSGISLVDARVGLARAGEKILAERRGELLFTHKGLSGPAALDLSGELTARTSGALREETGREDGSFEVALDLLPLVSHERLQGDLAPRERSRRTVSTSLHALELPRNLARALLRRAGVPEERSLAELRREERTSLVRALKDLRLAVSGTLGFDKAEVTAGGVSLDAIDPRTLESKLVPGIFFIGEVLDVDGPIGGYNFQIAWSTGHAAGSAV
ncbi:NAD(P)/FAD-dependent oxidoreductase [bacterium]|nr:NAD(P)/FAD-dependent oxidoreductase [bacterium]